MKYGFLSDAHGDLDSLKESFSLLDDADEIIFLGDVAGDRKSEECIQFLREKESTNLLGNHDRWTFELVGLSKESLAFLEGLPLSAEKPEFIALHSDFEQKGGEIFFQYVQSSRDCEKAFAKYNQWLIFIGHSHHPCLNLLKDGRISYIPVAADSSFSLDRDSRYIINVGSARDCAVLFDCGASTLSYRFIARKPGQDLPQKKKGLLGQILGLLRIRKQS